MKLRSLLWMMPAALLIQTGCGPDFMSLYPLYTDRDLVFEQALVGAWTYRDKDDVETWRFEKSGDGYTLRTGEKDKPLKCHLVRLSNFLFLDATDVELGSTGIRGHQFYQVELGTGTLRIAALDGKWLGAKLTENALAHEVIPDGAVVIRAATLDLQAFVLTYAREPRAFPEWAEFQRAE